LLQSIKIVLIFTFGIFSQTKAQDRVPFDHKKYILAKVEVVWQTSFNSNTVVTFAGLGKGQEITVPYEEISNAIKN
jgi:outer membrane protein insertion porin family